ncbi:MAG: phosphatidylcholine synthase [Rhodomicrobium sp.]|nr:phosphatidylcholine synthase [Rhodomicrobium sp.]
MSLRSHSKFKLFAAAAVHGFTAMGAALGLLALLAASERNWTACFAWLGAALIVDGADGPLARFFEVKKVLPRFSGEDLDKIIDYLIYVAVPAFLVARSELVPSNLRLPLAVAIMMVSLYHFADRDSKTGDGYFVGFPAIWNVVVFYCFVLDIPPDAAGALIGLCAVLTFVPFRWVHPLRVRRLRPVTLAVIAAWAGASVTAIVHGFPGTAAERVIFILTAAYIVGLGLSAGIGRARHPYPAE